MEAPPAGGVLGRRSALGAGLAGAIAALTGGVSAAGATTPATGTPGTGTPGTGESTTTTTMPPTRPTAADVELLDHIQGDEIAVSNLYLTALAGTSLDDTQRTLLAVLQQSHAEYAQTVTGMLGRAATQTPSTAVATGAEAFTGTDATAILQAAYDLENQLVIGHVEAIGQLASSDAASLLASIVSAEARHSVALADLLGSTDLQQLLVGPAVGA